MNKWKKEKKKKTEMVKEKNTNVFDTALQIIMI